MASKISNGTGGSLENTALGAQNAANAKLNALDIQQIQQAADEKAFQKVAQQTMQEINSA
jgi:hypothetical protein